MVENIGGNGLHDQPAMLSGNTGQTYFSRVSTTGTFPRN